MHPGANPSVHASVEGDPAAPRKLLDGKVAPLGDVRQVPDHRESTKPDRSVDDRVAADASLAADSCPAPDRGKVGHDSLAIDPRIATNDRRPTHPGVAEGLSPAADGGLLLDDCAAENPGFV
ncbi:hypothetical protein ABIB25_005415 [Nakamurella sp. UYEF19]|uniref:hypothetical protein n=1 Tax=Nakamurella sp. UYEF19 TaxID=1756392 RepID=UPI00339108F8